MVFLLFARFKIVVIIFALLKGITNNCNSALPMNLESRKVFFVSFQPSASWAWIMSPGDVHIIIFGISGWGNCGKTSFFLLQMYNIDGRGILFSMGKGSPCSRPLCKCADFGAVEPRNLGDFRSNFNGGEILRASLLYSTLIYSL